MCSNRYLPCVVCCAVCRLLCDDCLWFVVCWLLVVDYCVLLAVCNVLLALCLDVATGLLFVA